MQLLHGVCADVLALRMAGDLHHYCRHEAASTLVDTFGPKKFAREPVRDGLSNIVPPERAVPLITCGGGGAFTHGTPWLLLLTQ